VMDSFTKALLGEGLASCDQCGHVEPMDRFVTIYLGEHGEHIDLCQRCLDGDGWGSSYVFRRLKGSEGHE
jgi:hypothetical protein